MTQLNIIERPGMWPLDPPIVGPAISKRLREDRAFKGEKPTAASTRLRCSDARACSRKITFGMLKIPKDIEIDDDTLMAFRVGDWYHQIVQEAMTRELDARCEVVIDWSPDISLSGSCDAVYGDPIDGVVAAEIKSMKGFPFDLSVGNKKTKLGPGPKLEHVVQAGLYGLAPQIEADFLHMVYVSKDNGACAEWMIGIDEPLTHLENAPTVRSLVDEEIARLRGILATVDGGEIAERYVPGYGLVELPPEPKTRGADPWNCAYCAWQPTCKTLPVGSVPIGDVKGAT